MLLITSKSLVLPVPNSPVSPITKEVETTFPATKSPAISAFPITFNPSVLTLMAVKLSVCVLSVVKPAISAFFALIVPVALIFPAAVIDPAFHVPEVI